MAKKRFVIKHLSGSLRGEEQSFSDDRQQITFGRREENDVVFPPEETAVGRWHFALVRKPWGDSSIWRIDLFGEHYVEVDGVEAEPGQPLRPDAKIRLGTEKGPRFQFIDTAWDPVIYTPVRSKPQPNVPISFYIALFIVLIFVVTLALQLQG